MPLTPPTSPTSTTPTNTPLPPVLWPLLFGNFVIGTGVMIVPGTLNDIRSSLASVVAEWDRRRLLALMFSVAVTLLSSSGQFILVSYLAPYSSQVARH